MESNETTTCHLQQRVSPDVQPVFFRDFLKYPEAKKCGLGGGNSNIFYFHPYLGEDSHFDENIFQMGWFNHQLVVDKFDLEKPYCFKMEKSHNNLTIQSSRQSKNETSNQFRGGGV